MLNILSSLAIVAFGIGLSHTFWYKLHRPCLSFYSKLLYWLTLTYITEFYLMV